MNVSIINEKIKQITRRNAEGSLQESNMNDDPFQQFMLWFDEVLDSGIYDPSAMVLATIDESGLPDTRVVLLKELEQNRFIFYTNYHSKKARELEKNPNVAINFYWPSLVRQVRLRGRVEKVSREQSEQYFLSRPREAQIGVYASHQSETIADRAELEDKIQHFTKQFENQPVPYPDFWGGYVIVPFEYEFFHGRKWRAHDRIFYHLENGKWKKVRLAP